MSEPAPPADSSRAPARAWLPRVGRWAVSLLPLVAVAAVGAFAAIALFGSTTASIGPFDTTMTATPFGARGTEVELAPLGQIGVDSHRGPLGLTIELDQLREADARAIAEDPDSFRLDEAALTAEVRAGIVDLGRRVVLASTLGGVALAVLARRRWQSAVAGALVGLLVAGGSIGAAASTWEPEALAEPRYSGLLSLAPQAVGDARDVVDRFADYQAQLAGLIENVAVLYQGAEDIRSFRPDDSTVRALHVSDLHLNPQAFDLIDRIVPQFGIDLVIDTGDINDWGTTFESRFVERIGDLPVPYVFVRGNHDSAATARAVAQQTNAIVLDGEGTEVAGLTIWGQGDPRFTPDKSRAGSGADQREVAEADAPVVAQGVRRFGADEIDVVLVHDPLQAGDLGDLVPLVLAGHRHAVDQITLGDDTLLLVEGSTGGAGLRSLQGDAPVPLSCSVLYFDATSGDLQALDRIEVGGVNQSDIRIERTVIAEPEADPDDEADQDDEELDPDGGTSSERTTTTTEP